MVAQKTALQMLWKGTCNVFTKTDVINPVTKRTEKQETKIITNEPCKLSFKTLKTTTESNHAAAVGQSTTLFISNEVQIPPGSKIEVTQNGKTVAYEASGQPGFFTHHQEIPLDLFKGFA